MKSEGNHPLAKVKPIKPVVPRDIDTAKITLYFRLSKTFLTASVAIAGVTLMYE